ncbi:DinB family protein [Flavobacterium humi]|uniref:DUF1572 domain-containing protein n=1 Tax=Flavobacterium humi TaxID=2562683 RepID=A0A4Z0LCF8_9FLAO|nr:DUF1572 family protein [Flavobacterium humi]TGD59582.1 DUF1572 domain-containing protein [Flavobacterium humi]
MLTDTLQQFFERDLNKLKQEIAAYTNEKSLWEIDKNIANSGGNLCLHLIGNLNWFIGATFGKTGYVRNRELEFSQKSVPRQELIRMIDETIPVVKKGLEALTEEDLKADYPIIVFEKATTTEQFLVHLTTHLSYHLGQINYHRRLLDI